MHLSSSKSGAVLPPGPDACQITRAQLGQDPPQRTVLGVLTENGQYRRACGQVTMEKHWGSCLLRKNFLSWWAVGFSCSSTYELPLSIPTVESELLGHCIFKDNLVGSLFPLEIVNTFFPQNRRNRSRNCLG